MTETRSAVAACAKVGAGLGFAVADPLSMQSVEGEIAVRTLVPTVTFAVHVLTQAARPPSAIATRFLRSVVSEVKTSAAATPGP